MDHPPEKRRRIDRITAPDLLEGVEERPAAELRELRDECRQEESRLSYARRMVQGQLDIARSEQERRRGGDAAETDLLSALPQILADEHTGGVRTSRTVSFYTPGDDGRRAGDAGVEGPSLGQVPDLDDAELAGLVERLRDEENRVSEQRRVVLTHLDALQAELVRRYRDGSVGVDEIMSASLPQPPQG